RDWRNPKPIEPGRIYEYTIDLQATSNVFKAGHRIRVQITSSNFPLWARNLNTGAPVATGDTFQPAHQTIHHDETHPSHIILPLIPQTAERRS
ncbi:MAG TPA: CocE/NonD family hydrolase, partial [Abditibacteriaceae bacterium]|nr:CocE/NonD family hydrolase [Abditibacteriaceae bacterium]